MHSPLFVSIENSAFSSAIASSEWMFPTIETVHVFAIVTVIGTIAIMDMRLLGLASRNRTVKAMEHDTIPVTWIAFGLAVITGALLFVSKATSYMANPYFLWKMGLMLLAGVNMAVFHRILSKNIAEWDAPGAAAPMAAKVSGLLSLLLWMVIPFCGRAVGFTLGVYY
ncbi:MAG: hypothetical protein H6R45_737 [Proteobacteria bacterium]|nr:hypothetical protein [Pseudomonadota bacterium]